jgi:ubiquitin conjugation factor E4 B
VIGPPELVNCLISLSSLSNPLSNATTYYALAPSDVPQFLQDLTQRFAEDDDFALVLGPVIVQLLHHESLSRSEGLGGADSGWRGVVGGMEALVSIKPIAALITKLPHWNPPEVTAADIETVSLMGPLLRLGVFYREWVRL